MITHDKLWYAMISHDKKCWTQKKKNNDTKCIKKKSWTQKKKQMFSKKKKQTIKNKNWNTKKMLNKNKIMILSIQKNVEDQNKKKCWTKKIKISYVWNK